MTGGGAGLKRRRLSAILSALKPRVLPLMSSVTELAGIAALVLAAWLWLPLVGLVVLGAALIYVAQAFG